MEFMSYMYPDSGEDDFSAKTFTPTRAELAEEITRTLADFVADSDIFVFEKLSKIERYINANYYHIRDSGLLDNLYVDVIQKIFENPEVIWICVLGERRIVSAIRCVIDEIKFRYN